MPDGKNQKCTSLSPTFQGTTKATTMRLRLLSTSLVFAAGIRLWTGVAVAQDNLRLYVGSSRGDDVDVIDMGSLKVIGDIKAESVSTEFVWNRPATGSS